MNETPEEVLIALRPVELGQKMPGADVIVAGCGHTCWIAPSSLAAMKEQPVQTFCLNCMPRGISDVRILPGVRDELVAMYGPERAERALDDLKVLQQFLQAANQEFRR